MTLINGDRIITAKLYDDEHEEFIEKTMSIIDCLNAYTDEGVTEANVVEQPRWIPVSERLPEDKTYVLTTIKVPKRIAHARSGWYDGGFFMNDNGDTWRATDKEVIAWMPLPEPYKEVQNGFNTKS